MLLSGTGGLDEEDGGNRSEPESTWEMADASGVSRTRRIYGQACVGEIRGYAVICGYESGGGGSQL